MNQDLNELSFKIKEQYRRVKAMYVLYILNQNANNSIEKPLLKEITQNGTKNRTIIPKDFGGIP